MYPAFALTLGLAVCLNWILLRGAPQRPYSLTPPHFRTRQLRFLAGKLLPALDKQVALQPTAVFIRPGEPCRRPRGGVTM
jgi:hypothetical protein